MNAVVKKVVAPVAPIPATLTATHMRVAQGVPVMSLLAEVLAQPQLWNTNPCRLSKVGPHHETEDMVLRYRDETPFRESGDWSKFSDEHLSTWNRTIDYLPTALPLIFDLMRHVRGEVLGGVFLYRVRPQRQIYAHIDRGWHANYYDKFNVCLSSNPQTRFQYETDAMVQEAGDIHWFRNDVMHSVLNEGDTDHIVLTVCIAIDRGIRDPWSPPGWTMDSARHVAPKENL